MSISRWSIASAFVVSVLLLANISGQQPTPPGKYTAGEILVKFSGATNAAQRNGILAGRVAARLRRFDRLDIEHLRLLPGLSVEQAIAIFQRIPGVVAVQPNFIRRAIQNGPPPDDPFWLDGSLWGLEKIQANAVWSNFTVGDGSVVVADIDTGVDYTHPDLAANMWHNPLEIPDNGIDDDGNGYIDDVYGIDAVNHDGDPMDDQGHGTHTSGTIAAAGNNTLGVTGVAWNAKILSCKFLSAAGEGTDAGAIECFNYIVAMRNRGVNIRVSSNSWGSPRDFGAPSTALQAAIDAAGDVGIINIFGAGNDGTDNDAAPFDPASYSSPSIVSVASSGPTDRRSFFSNFGATSVDLAAPGEDILSTYLGDDYAYLSGTSMATPHVAGAAALLATIDPTLPVALIKTLLMDNVDQSSRWAGRVVSGGRLNVFSAAQAIGPGNNNVPPSVAITAPSEGTTTKEPATFTVEAIASDSDGTVQKVSFYANGAPLGADTTSPYSVTWVNAPAGNYTLTAVATDDRGSIAVSASVHIVVEPNTPPTVTITSPLEGATFTSPATVTMTADAGDSDGSVASVAFYSDGTLIETDTTAPYGATWDVATGNHTLTAIATDDKGATTSSASIHITVNPIPGRINMALTTSGSVANASSIYNGNYPPSGAINGDRKGLNWGAGGAWNDGTQNQGPDWIEVAFNGLKLIEEVNVFSMQDNYGSPVEPTPAMTFTYYGLRGFEVQYWTGADWEPVPGGFIADNTLVWRQVLFVPVTTTKIRVLVTAALNGYSRVMEVEAWGVGAGGNAPPEVAITSPAGGAAFTAPATININAVATDTDGTIDQVAFFANGAPIGVDSAAPFSIPWSGVATGSYTLTAIATDNQGATTTSAPIQITVTPANTPPSVAISSPIEGASFTAPASFSISANATDSDGTVTSVAFYLNAVPIGTDTSSPFSAAVNGLAAGAYTLSAVATDNQGLTVTSAAVHVTVAQPPGRSNVALASNGGVATASSIYNANYPASGAINGDRKGLNWGAGGGWNDGTPNASPDWIEVAFNGSKTVDEINVFSMQDNYASPVEPTPTMTFTYYGLRNFEVQYWNGSGWTAVPGGVITNNTLVRRQVLFSGVTTTKIRVYITGALNGYSRVMEVEAWGVSGGAGNTPPSVSISSPAEGATFTAPANITIDASASDTNGSIQQVAFYGDGLLIGTDTSSPYSATWNNVTAGNHTITAVATDNQSATTTSAAVHVMVAQSPGRKNVALATNGGAATASSTYNANYPVSSVINGDRKGLNWGTGGGWNDGTQNASPDWIEISFNGSKTIDEVNVFSMQDSYNSPSEPTPTMTFTWYGLRAFEVQYWNGSAWVAVPGGAVINNTLVWRQVLFAPVTTTKIRVFITGALNGYSRVMEVEAWGQ